MSLAEGMDVARVRQIADSLGRNGEQLREVRGVGTASMSVLAVTWEGADVEGCRDAHGGHAWGGVCIPCNHPIMLWMAEYVSANLSKYNID